jgi:hypothetical protein
MKIAAFGLVAALCLLPGCRSQAPGEKHWQDHAAQLNLFEGRELAAIAYGGGRLYVSTGANVFIVGPDMRASTDATARINKEPGDHVTGILVDSAAKDVWIVLNSNTYLASCYDYDIAPKRCSGAFLDERVRLAEALEKSGPQSSVNALDFDREQAIVGYFKDGVYLRSMKDGQQKLVYRESPNHWASSAVLTKSAGFVAVPGDGLVVVDRQTATAVRYADRDGASIRALAAGPEDLYLAAKGLYRAKIKAYLTSH